MIYILWCTYMLICWQVITCTDKLETQKMLTDDWGRYVMLCHLTHNISPLNSPWITLKSPANQLLLVCWILNERWHVYVYVCVGVYGCIWDRYRKGTSWVTSLFDQVMPNNTYTANHQTWTKHRSPWLSLCLSCFSLYLYTSSLSLSLSLSLKHTRTHIHIPSHVPSHLSFSLSLSLCVCVELI